jgi:poly(A) polymerase
VNLNIPKHCGLDAAEGEGESLDRRIRAMSFLFHLGKGKRDRRRVPMRRQRIDPGAARIAQSQQLCDLVEGLAGRIVERGADVAIGKALALIADKIKMGMATGNDQGQRSSIAQFEHFTMRQQNRVNMTLKMINGDERLAQSKGERLGIGDSNQKCACQAGAFCDRDCVQIGKADAGFVQRRAHHGNDIAQVFARGKFRNHTTIRRMNSDLRRHDAREDKAPALDHRGCGLITGAFDSQNQAPVISALGARKELAGLTHLSIVVGMETNPARDAATAIVARLRAAGHQAYFVGGCVRDLVLGRAPKDFDVATSATPNQVLGLFEKTFAVGAHFGVVLVCTGEITTEVATFRSDGAYSDGRHPDAVRFSTSPEEDVKRRDFTINGMMMDPVNDSVLDMVGGMQDLDARLIRAIGDPSERFTEDKLRMLRAVRFAARFTFDLEPATAKAIEQLAPAMNQVSNERVRDELTRMLTEGHARRAFEMLDATGLLAQVLPEVVKLKGVAQPPQYHPEGDVWVHTLMLLDGLPAGTPLALAWGALLHDIGKPVRFRVAPDRIRFDGHVEAGVRIAGEICKRLRFPNHETEQILALIDNHMRFADVRKMKESTLKRFFRLQNFDQHLALHRLDCLASHGLLELYDFARERFETLPKEEVRPHLLLSGKDLIEAGYQPGPQFSQMLAAAEDAQLEGTVQTREEALTVVKERWPQP